MTKTFTPWRPLAGDKRRVVVVGAGIAGLTAAHELVERGFDVQVVEAALNPEAPFGDEQQVLIGGMARTSWASIPSLPDQYPLEPEPRAPSFTAIRPSYVPPLILTTSDVMSSSSKDPDFGSLSHWLALYITPPLRVSVLVVGSADAVVMAALKNTLDHWVRGRWSATNINLFEDSQEAATFQFVSEGARVPGEHGFRFFPSFYRHMFDTLTRIPIADPSTSNTAPATVNLSPSLVSFNTVVTSDSSRTVFDALRSADSMGLGLLSRNEHERSYEISRRPIRSLQELRILLHNVLERSGYRGQDIYRLTTRYLEYLTSSPERRRAQYEDMPWSKFLGLDANYSKYFAAHVNGGAQALAAMSSDTNDARTIGSVAMQLTLDELRVSDSGYSDATLRGPTSLSLFDPWQNYLETQGVRIAARRLVGFSGHGMAVRPVFAVGADPSYDYKVDDSSIADYYVIAIPVDKFQRLFDKNGAPVFKPTGRGWPELLHRDQLIEANQRCIELDMLDEIGKSDAPLAGVTASERNDLDKYINYPLGDYEIHPDAGPLRYMSGVQFYFDDDVRLFLGHTLCLDSPWGVSYISQEQYWQDKARGQTGVRGVLSAIFTRFEISAVNRNGRNPKNAMDCDESELVERVWKQISDTWDTKNNGPIPTPHYYFLDENLRRENGRWTNATPYLVNRVGDWSKRGGARTPEGEYAYALQFGHTVFAGTFMRTTTRLNSMEAANESGRRAVNTILDRESDQPARVPIYNMEDYEIPELRSARELDARIWRRGGGHMIRSAAVESALRAIPWDLVRLALPTRGESR